MGPIKRKPPVVAIRGTHTEDVVTQRELKKLAEMQAAEWQLNQTVARMIMQVEGRIHHGALWLDLRCLEDESAFVAQIGALPAA